MSTLSCPACGASKIRLAARKSLSDVLLGGLTIYPFRCQLCADRFRTFLGRRTPNPRRSFDRVEVSFPVWFKSRRSSPSPGLGHEGVIDNLSIRGCRIRSTVDGAIGLRFTKLHRSDERRIRQLVDVWLPELLPTSELSTNSPRT